MAADIDIDTVGTEGWGEDAELQLDEGESAWAQRECGSLQQAGADCGSVLSCRWLCGCCGWLWR